MHPSLIAGITSPSSPVFVFNFFENTLSSAGSVENVISRSLFHIIPPPYHSILKLIRNLLLIWIVKLAGSGCDISRSFFHILFPFWHTAPRAVSWPMIYALSIKFGRNFSCEGLDLVPWDNVAQLDIAADDVAWTVSWLGYFAGSRGN